MVRAHHTCDGCPLLRLTINGRYCTKLRQNIEFLTTKKCKQ